MSSEGRCSFTVRTVYRCDVCGFEVGHHREIIQHLKVHIENAESISHDVSLDSVVTQPQDDVMSSTTVLPLKKSSQNLKRVLIQASDDQVVSEPVDSKLLVCTKCGRTYKYKRSFERHIEQEHKTATQLTSFETVSVSELHCTADLSDNLNSADCELRHDESGNSSADDLLNVSDQIELQEVTDTLDDVLTSVSDNKQMYNSQIAPYCCPDCPKQFHARNSLKIHITNKHLGCTFVCKWCGQLFVEGCELQSHVIAEHNKSMDNSTTDSLQHVFSSHSCLICGLHYQSEETLEKHMALHSDSLSTQVCSKCSGRFLSKSLLRCHVQQVHSGDLPYQKKLCRHVHVAHTPSLACHVPIVTSSSSLVQCDSTVTSETPAKTDNVNLNGSRKCDWSCDETGSAELYIPRHNRYCDTVTPINDELSSHKNDKVSVPCPECGAAFFWRSNLLRHIRKQHQGNKTSNCHQSSDLKQKHLQCIRCGRWFSCRRNLRKHLQAHDTVEKSGGARLGSYLCSQCGQKMTTAHMLHIHTLRHAGVRPHRCKLCDKSFYVVTELNSHVSVVHHGNRFICDQCGHEANSRSALRIHCRSAHPTPGVEPSFLCSVCSRRFWSPAALRRHTVAHDLSRSSIRKAVCSICSLAFRHIYNLSHHIKTTHTDADCSTPFACATCHQQFDSGPAFKTHYRSKHRNR